MKPVLVVVVMPDGTATTHYAHRAHDAVEAALSAGAVAVTAVDMRAETIAEIWADIRIRAKRRAPP